MDLMREKIIDISRIYAELLSESLRGVAGIALTGSISNKWPTDSSSDIDMIVYLDMQSLPDSSALSSWLSIDETRIRRRTYLLEYRLELDGHDTNIKLFTLDYLKSNIEAEPTLDQQYLEELESYSTQIVLVDNLNIKKLFSSVKDIISYNSLRLTCRAIERYGKGVGWAVFQWYHRNYKTVAIHAICEAFDSLLCSYYLTEGRLPPSLKWRASKRAILELRNGEDAFKLIEAWGTQLGILNFSACLEILNKFEKLVSMDYTINPWTMYEERWWWLEYNSLDTL